MIKIWSKKWPEHIFGTRFNDEEVEDQVYELFRGKYIDDLNFDVRIEFPKCTKSQLLRYECLSWLVGIPLVGQRMKTALLQYVPDSVQFVPAIIQTKDGVVTDYSLANVACSASVIDFENSQTVMFSNIDEVMTFEPGGLVLLDKALPGYQIARDPSYSSMLFISGELAEALERMKFKGFAPKTALEAYPPPPNRN